MRNCVSSYCLESKFYKHSHAYHDIQSHLQVWRHAKTMQRNVNHTSAGLVKCQLPIIYSAVPEKGYSLLHSLRISFCCYRCVFISFVLYLLLSLSLSGRFWGDDSWRGKGSNLQGVHPLAGQGVMAPAAGDSSQWPTAGPPWLSSSPGCGHASPGLYEVEYIKVSLIGS